MTRMADTFPRREGETLADWTERFLADAEKRVVIPSVKLKEETTREICTRIERDRVNQMGFER